MVIEENKDGQSKKATKKLEKDAAKAAKKAEYKSAAAPTTDVADTVDYSAGKYGAPKMIQVPLFSTDSFWNFNKYQMFRSLSIVTRIESSSKFRSFH